MAYFGKEARSAIGFAGRVPVTLPAAGGRACRLAAWGRAQPSSIRSANGSEPDLLSDIRTTMRYTHLAKEHLRSPVDSPGDEEQGSGDPMPVKWVQNRVQVWVVGQCRRLGTFGGCNTWMRGRVVEGTGLESRSGLLRRSA